MPTVRRSAAAVLTLAILAAAAGDAAHARSAGERTGGDLAWTVTPGDRLEIRNYAGRVVVTGSDGDRVEVRAEHPADEAIVGARRGASLRVAPRSWARDADAFAVRLPGMVRVRITDRQPPPAVTLRATLPRWMPVLVESPYGDVAIEGTEAAVRVVTATGDIEVAGAGSPISLVSMSGRIVLEDADGRLTLGGARGRIAVRTCGGDLRVETTSGDIVLEDLATDHAEATSLSGGVRLRGPLTAGGTYVLSTHDGDIELALPAGALDARISAHAIEGRVDAPWPAEEADPGRLDVTLGAGAARLRLGTFSGTIAIRPAARDPD